MDEGVLLALKRSQVFADETAVQENWPKLRKFFAETLSLHRTLGVASKAGTVHTQHERVFKGATILTDIRPIFHVDVGEEPEATVVVHMLRITQGDSQRQEGVARPLSDLYFALDGNDLKTLQSVIDRAIKKEETIRKVMKKVNIPCLRPEATY